MSPHQEPARTAESVKEIPQRTMDDGRSAFPMPSSFFASSSDRFGRTASDGGGVSSFFPEFDFKSTVSEPGFMKSTASRTAAVSATLHKQNSLERARSSGSLSKGNTYRYARVSEEVLAPDPYSLRSTSAARLTTPTVLVSRRGGAQIESSFPLLPMSAVRTKIHTQRVCPLGDTTNGFAPLVTTPLAINTTTL